MSNLTPNLSECCICKGNIWTDNDSIYQMQDERNHYFNAPYHEVMNLPYKWEKSWLGKYKDIAFIKICDRCFCASAINDEIFTFYATRSGMFVPARMNYVYGKISDTIGRDSVKNLIKQDFDKILSSPVEKHNEQQDAVLVLLSKITDRTDEYRDIVKGLALKEIEDIKNAEGKEREKKKKKNQIKQKENRKIKRNIINVLKSRNQKIPASEIDAILKHRNVDRIKKFSEQLYRSGKINRTGNYRYFILTEKKKTPKKSAAKKSKPRKTSAPKTASVADEIKKFADLKDQGILTQEEFDAKKKELLGL